MLGDFDRGGAGGVFDRGFRHVVSHGPRRRNERMRGTDDYDRPAATLPDHLLSGGPHQVKRAPHRDVDGAAKPFHVRDVKNLAIAVGGVADRDVQATKAFHRVGDEPLDRLLIGDVGLKRDRVATLGRDRVDHFLGLFRVGTEIDADFRAASSQFDGRGAADAETGACDQGHFACEFLRRHASLPLLPSFTFAEFAQFAQPPSSPSRRVRLFRVADPSAVICSVRQALPIP